MFQNAELMDAGARPFKPLPPIVTKQAAAVSPRAGHNLMASIDRPLRDHLCALLQVWLAEAKLPSSLHNALLPALVPLVRSWLEAEHDVCTVTTASSSSVFDPIYVQLLGAKAPNDSQFLPGVYFGKPLSSITGGLGGAQCEWLHHAVGGTIRIHGAPAGAAGDALCKVVAASVYTLWSLWLEGHVLHDCQIGEIPADRKQLPASPTGASPAPTAPRKGVLWWLFGSSKEAPSPVVQISKKAIRRSASFLKKDTITTPAASPSDSNNHRFGKLRKQLESARVSSSPRCQYPAPQIIARLQDEEDGLITIRTVMHESIASKLKHTGMQRRSSLLSIISSSHHHDQQQQQQQQLPLNLPQSIAAYSPLRVPGRICDNKLGLDGLVLDTGSVDVFIGRQHTSFSYTLYPVGCPQHPCAGPFLADVNFFSFVQRHGAVAADMPLGQAIQRWCEHAHKSCRSLQQQAENAQRHQSQPPDHQQQQQQQQQCQPVTTASDEADASTPPAAIRNGSSSQHQVFHGCAQPFKDHVLSFMHGPGRVQVYLTDDDDDTTAAMSSDSSRTLEQSYRGIEAWTVCCECNASTKRVPISIATYHYSLSKFFELVLYDTHFVPVAGTLCAHVQSSKAALIWCFKPHGTNISVRMTVEAVSLYELRPPRLQVMPDTTTPLRKGSMSEQHSSQPRRFPLSQRTLDKWKALVGGEVDAFFDAVSTHLEVMGRYIHAESKREQRDTSGVLRHAEIRQQLRARENELSQMRQLLIGAEHSTLVHELRRTPLDQLNDFRRFFAVRSSSVLSQLGEWQEKWCHDLMDGCAWTAPDYIESAQVHSFPGSSVVVREEEPSSIIAYTLSSNDYLEEIQEQKQSGNVNGGTIVFADQSPAGSSDVSSAIPKPSDDPNVVDRYHSIITRKYVAPNTGASSETASFRSMVIETVKTNAEELHYQQSRKIHDIKHKLSHAIPKPTHIGGGDKRGDSHQHHEDVRVMLDKRPMQATDSDRFTMEEIKKLTSSYETKPLPQHPDPEKQSSVSPHIKHKFIHNNMEFTCITYYAEEFESLRRQSGIDQLLVQSLTRCSAWTASGGKSKSHFYKTQDDRFVIKEMVNTWNNIEKESILKFAPKYFEHMKQSEDTPSILAKIFGFYTIRMRNVGDKRVLLDLDVLVMEHLFYGATPQITQRFDFKGLRDRHVEECLKQQKSDTTLWDGDWLQGFRLAFPVHDHSKRLLKKAILNDTQFLASRNIMDYSLLLGIDEARKELTVGIVDFIGAYTWYKKMENKSKSTLHPYKEVTVVPPEQYRWRFCRMVEEYFVAVPGKFDLIQPNQMHLQAWI